MTKQLIVPLLLLINTAYARTRLELKSGDTVTYVPESRNPAWISVTSDEANLAVSLSEDGKKIKEQNHSKGIKSTERFYFVPGKNRNYEFKVWAASYVEKARTVQVIIKESERLSPLESRFSTEEFLEDLHMFRSIREKVNSGLYVYRSKPQIDSIYKWAEREVAASRNIFDFYKVIAKLTVFEGSCHNFTELPNYTSYYLTQKPEYLPITLKNVDGRLLQDSQETLIPLGAEIVSINGISSQQMISRLSQYYSADGFSVVFREAAGFEKGLLDKFYIEFGTHKNYDIAYQWKGRLHGIRLSGISFDQAKKLQESRYSVSYSGKDGEKYRLDKVTDGMYRLVVKTFDFATDQNDPAYKKFSSFLDAMMKTLENEKAGHLIIDLRGNGGGAGALYEKVFSYLTQHPFRDSRYAYTLFNEAPLKERLVMSPLFLVNGVKDGYGLDAYLKQLYPREVQGKYYWTDEKNPLILPNKKTFKGQLYLFIDEHVASAGSHLASLIKSYTNAIVIGRETNGGYYEHNGHLPVVYELPNTRIQTGFSIVHVIQDAQVLDDQKKGSGVVPHIKIQTTDQEFLNHTDVYLKKAVEIKKQ